MQQTFGYNLPKSMHPEFGALIKAECDHLGRELSSNELFDVFNKNYIDIFQMYKLLEHKISKEAKNNNLLTFKGTLLINSTQNKIEGYDNGPIDAFFNALKSVGIDGFKFISYHEHAISACSDSKAIAYIELERPDKTHIFGV